MIMHELNAVQGLLEKALQKAKEAQARRITHLYLVLGGDFRLHR